MITKLLIVAAGLCALVEQTVQIQCYECTKCEVNDDTKYEKKTCDENDQACSTKVKDSGEVAKSCAAVVKPEPEKRTGYVLYYCGGDLCNGLAHNKEILKLETPVNEGVTAKAKGVGSSMSPMAATEEVPSSCRSWIINSGHYKLLHVTFLIYIIHF